MYMGHLISYIAAFCNCNYAYPAGAPNFSLPCCQIHLCKLRLLPYCIPLRLRVTTSSFCVLMCATFGIMGFVDMYVSYRIDCNVHVIQRFVFKWLVLEEAYCASWTVQCNHLWQLFQCCLLQRHVSTKKHTKKY